MRSLRLWVPGADGFARAGAARSCGGRAHVWRPRARVVTMYSCGNHVTVSPASDGSQAATGSSVESLRRLVGNHVAGDAREEASKTRILAELGRLGSPCSRDEDPVHVTASSVVVGIRGTVLHRHRRLGRWLQPGGHVDAGESPDEAALRETQEETGLSAAHPPNGPELIHVDVHPAATHVHLDLRYLLFAPPDDPSPLPAESPDVQWFSWNDAIEIADEALIGALRRAKDAWGRSTQELGRFGSDQ